MLRAEHKQVPNSSAMSWTGVKKAINRAGTQVLVKAGQVDVTVDTEFEFEERRYRTMQTHSRKLHSELKHYLDTLRRLESAQLSLAKTLSSFYGDQPDEKAKSIAQDYFNALEKTNVEVAKAMETPYHQTVLNLVARYNLYYIEIDEAIKKREHKRLDYDALRAKVQKLIDRPEDEEKLKDLETQQKDASEVYEKLNQELKHELPRFTNLRIPFFDPSFEAFARLQMRYFRENYEALSQLETKLDASTRQEYLDGTLDVRLDLCLAKMRELQT